MYFNVVSAFKLLLCAVCCDIGVCLMIGQALYSHWENCINIIRVVLKLDAFYLLVSDYFKTSHGVYSTTLGSTWHVWWFKVLSYLRNLGHLVFQELPCLMGKVASIFPPTANFLWNIKVFLSVLAKGNWQGRPRVEREAHLLAEISKSMWAFRRGDTEDARMWAEELRVTPCGCGFLPELTPFQKTGRRLEQTSDFCSQMVGGD